MKVLLLSLVLLGSCSTRIGMRTPSTKMISPEAVGAGLKGEITTFQNEGTVAEVDLSQNTTGESLNLESKSEDGDFLGVHAEIGAFSSMDVVIYSPGDTSPLMGGVKYQIIGEPKLNAKAGNHSLSILAMAGAGSKEDENDDPIEITPQDDEVKTELDMTAGTTGLLYGYRLNSSMLVYLGGLYTYYNFNGILESDNNATLDGEEIDYNGEVVDASVGTIIDLGRLMSLKLEATNQKVNWEKTSARTFNYFAVGLSFNWY